MWLALALLLTSCPSGGVGLDDPWQAGQVSSSSFDMAELGVPQELISTWDEVQLASAIAYLQAQQRLRFPQRRHQREMSQRVEQARRGAAYLAQAHQLLMAVRRGLRGFSGRRRANAHSALTAQETAAFDRDLRKALHSSVAAAKLTKEGDLSSDAAAVSIAATMPWFETLESMIDIVILIAEARAPGTGADGATDWAPALDPAGIVYFANTLCGRTEPPGLATRVALALEGSPFEDGLRCGVQQTGTQPQATAKQTLLATATEGERLLIVNCPQLKMSAALELTGAALQLSTHQLWPTLVSVGRVQQQHDSSQNWAAFMTRLNQAALDGYQKFLTSDVLMDISSCDPSGPRFARESCGRGRRSNHLFFQWQQQPHAPMRSLVAPADLQQLEDLLTKACVAHVARSGMQSTLLADTANLRVQVWATVVGGVAPCITGEPQHEDHIHHGAVCAGAFYTQVPSGGEVAPLVFSDPRGTSTGSLYGDGVVEGLAQPPFVGQRAFFPSVGEIVVFPPWLVHGVGEQQAPEGGQKTRERISWSFNVFASGAALEAWSLTAD